MFALLTRIRIRILSVSATASACLGRTWRSEVKPVIGVRADRGLDTRLDTICSRGIASGLRSDRRKGSEKIWEEGGVRGCGGVRGGVGRCRPSTSILVVAMHIHATATRRWTAGREGMYEGATRGDAHDDGSGYSRIADQAWISRHFLDKDRAGVSLSRTISGQCGEMRRTASEKGGRGLGFGLRRGYELG